MAKKPRPVQGPPPEVAMLPEGTVVATRYAVWLQTAPGVWQRAGSTESVNPAAIAIALAQGAKILRLGLGD